jgi:hypothetical protein
MDRACSFPDCIKSAVATLGGCEYCVSHFVSTCYTCLEKTSNRANEAAQKERRNSLIDIVDTVTSLSLGSDEFTNQERGQLMDILLWACDSLAERT